MLILFPKRKGIKIATTLIFEEILAGAGYQFVMGMIYFAAKFGAITYEEQNSLVDYLIERDSH